MPSLTRVAPIGVNHKAQCISAKPAMPVGVLGAMDMIRPGVPQALQTLRAQGITRIELLSDDNERTSATLAAQLRIAYRPNLLPEEKIAIVKDYQAKGHTVTMFGGEVNDAPAMAQVDWELQWEQQVPTSRSKLPMSCYCARIGLPCRRYWA